MVIGILQFELLIRGAESIKDKRRVVSSLKDKLHREHMVSVAEVALQDKMSVARMALAVVGNDGKHIGQTLDRIMAKLRALHDAELSGFSREVLHDPRGEPLPEGVDPLAALEHDEELAAEMLRLGENAIAGDGKPEGLR
ncbi:MAG TPA: DUF503 domain-containing protein [Phycisphaerales bacterium]|nr:DUF503 domain-containing protein [Phycisphaerales bacterium]